MAATSPCGMTATQAMASFSSRCTAMRLNTSKRVMAGSNSAAGFQMMGAKCSALGQSEKYASQPDESTTWRVIVGLTRHCGVDTAQQTPQGTRGLLHNQLDARANLHDFEFLSGLEDQVLAHPLGDNDLKLGGEGHGLHETPIDCISQPDAARDHNRSVCSDVPLP